MALIVKMQFNSISYTKSVTGCTFSPRAVATSPYRTEAAHIAGANFQIVDDPGLTLGITLNMDFSFS